MIKSKILKYNASATIAGRCLRLSVRNPDTVFSSIMLPAVMMLLFVSLFGNLIRIENTSYVNYIVPGILLQCIAQCSSTTAVMVNRDMTNGIADRFCTLPVRQSALLNGHVCEAVVRCLFTSVIVMAAAALTGFRPSASPAGWITVLILLTGTILAMSWLSAVIGIAAHSAEGASAFSSLVIILPYLSSGFVPADSLPAALQFFARHQPMTSVIDTLRAALLGTSVNTSLFLTALAWCAGLTIIFRLISLALFGKRFSR